MTGAADLTTWAFLASLIALAALGWCSDRRRAKARSAAGKAGGGEMTAFASSDSNGDGGGGD